SKLLTLSKTAKPDKIAKFLASLFPHMTKLVCGLEDSALVALLLQHWSGSLEHVTIIGKLYKQPARQLFWSASNSMPELKRLVFHDITEDYYHSPYAYFAPPSVTVFNQLEHLAITGRSNQVYDIFGYRKPEQDEATEAVPLKGRNLALAANLTHLLLTYKP